MGGGPSALGRCCIVYIYIIHKYHNQKGKKSTYISLFSALMISCCCCVVYIITDGQQQQTKQQKQQQEPQKG